MKEKLGQKIARIQSQAKLEIKKKKNQKKIILGVEKEFLELEAVPVVKGVAVVAVGVVVSVVVALVVLVGEVERKKVRTEVAKIVRK
ncbi:unnamed protein product [Brachionus calyciflorus]|uniref:Uncharacterized protein n=1 Tax=Brachionus calyciflorus TaxID=104777 RepID=A0A814CMM9_9BILA|nr:unnamed protein product [Brachionus calyciflorus]